MAACPSLPRPCSLPVAALVGVRTTPCSPSCSGTDVRTTGRLHSDRSARVARTQDLHSVAAPIAGVSGERRASPATARPSCQRAVVRASRAGSLVVRVIAWALGSWRDRQGTRRRPLGFWSGCPRSRCLASSRCATIDSPPPLRTGRAPFTHPAPRRHLHTLGVGFRFTTRPGTARP
jgi:hypothetical protein